MTPKLPRSYWRQFTATTVSNIGDGMTAAAMPLLAISLTDDARLIAGVAVAAMLPWLALSLPAGVWIDRWNRRHVMVGANLVRAVVYAAIAVLAATQSLTVIMLLSLVVVVGCAEVFFDMSAQAFLPSIVEHDSLDRANGYLYATEVVSNSFLGLPAGAWLFAVAAALPFGVDALSYLAAAALVASIVPTRPQPAADTAATAGFGDQLREGMSWLWRHRTLRTLAILLGVTNMAFAMGESIFVKFAFDELGVGARGFGLLLAAMSLGSIVGGVAGGRIARRLGAGTSIVAAYAVFSVADAVRAGIPTIAVVTVTSVVVALAGTVWNVVTVSYRQRVIPSELFGRVNSAYRFIGTGSIAVGAFVGGQIAHLAGTRAPFFVASLVTTVALPFAVPVSRDPDLAPPQSSSQSLPASVDDDR